MDRLTRDGTIEPVSRGQILRRKRGQGNIHFPCSADHEQDWQPYPVDPYSAISDDHTSTVDACGGGGGGRVQKKRMVRVSGKTNTVKKKCTTCCDTSQTM